MDKDSKKTHIYVYEMPYCERKEFCNIIDLNDKWEELGKYYKYITTHIMFSNRFNLFFRWKVYEI